MRKTRLLWDLPLMTGPVCRCLSMNQRGLKEDITITVPAPYARHAPLHHSPRCLLRRTRGRYPGERAGERVAEATQTLDYIVAHGSYNNHGMFTCLLFAAEGNMGIKITPTTPSPPQ